MGTFWKTKWLFKPGRLSSLKNGRQRVEKIWKAHGHPHFVKADLPKPMHKTLASRFPRGLYTSSD